MSNILAGTARINITPQEPIHMGGFGQRTTEHEGVHDPLYTKALYLSNDRGAKLLWITNDLLHIPGDIRSDTVKQIKERTGLSEDQILISASHTHSGPAVRDNIAPTEAMQRYAEYLATSFAEAGSQAIEAARPSKIRMGTGKGDFSVNRRTRGNPNIVDDRIIAMAVEDDASGETSAVLFGIGLHPVCIGYENYLISADYPGYAQKLIEEKLPAKNALFFNMAEGNMIPSTRVPTDSMDPRGYNGRDFGAAEKIGTLLSKEVISILQDAPYAADLQLASRFQVIDIRANKYDLDPDEAMQRMQENQRVIAEYLGEEYFAGASLENPAPLKSLWSDACRVVVEQDMPEDEMHRLLSSICHFRMNIFRAMNPGDNWVAMPIQVIRINDYQFLALPGEVLIEVAFAWEKATNSEKSFIVALANDHFGYLPHSTNFDEPGAQDKYETIMHFLEPKAMDLAVEEAYNITQTL